MNYDYAIHSDYLIHWTGKDIDAEHQADWYESVHSRTNLKAEAEYIRRLQEIVKHGLWMTEEPEQRLSDPVTIPATPKCCFTELKVSESRKHARHYGRLGIGVKRPFLFTRYGRPLAYFGFGNRSNDKCLKACALDLQNKDMMNFFKPMNSSGTLNYDWYGESEWRIIFFKELLENKSIIDPRQKDNEKEYKYFQSLTPKQQLKYLIPLDGWFQMIIYPSLAEKNRAQKDASLAIVDEIKRIKSLRDHGNAVEKGNWPIEVDLDACRNF